MGNLCGTPLADEGGGVLQLGGTPHKQDKHRVSGLPTPTAASAAPSQRGPSIPSPQAQAVSANDVRTGERSPHSAFEQACSGSKLEALAVEYLSKEMGDGHAVFGQEEGGDKGAGKRGEVVVKGAEMEEEEEEERTVRWQQGELIGAGAFGRVYLGLNLDTGQLMAVKQVSIARDVDVQGRVAEHVRNLEAEVHVLKQLHHPNIVRYLGTERCMADMSLNIFLEFVPGGSIASLLAKFGSFTESVIRVYTKQILLGLEFLHTHQIMHRDIKGANILVDNSGVVKLADFGASKKIEDLVTVDSGCKSIKGTPYWMAPEVITQTGHGRQADIWSVGCTVIEMATGKPPWSQHFPVPMSAMFHIASSKHPPPLPERLSPEARDFLMLCFNRVPKERPNATRLLQHPFLSAALSSSGGAPSKLPTTAPQPTTALRPVTPPPDVTPPGPPPVPGSGFRYIPPNKPLSPVAEVNSAGLGSLGPSPLGRKPSEAAGRPGLPPVRKTSGRQGGLPEDAVAGPVFKSSMSVTDPLNESLALTVDSMMSSISYNPVEEPSWMQSMASSSSFALPPPQPIYFGKENAWPSPSGANIAGEKALAPLEPSEEPDQLPGDEEKIMEYVREKAFRETTRLSTPFLEHKVSGSSPAQQSMPGNSPPQVLNLEGPSPTALPPRPRVGRPVRPKTDNERMSKSRQWEAELERELEEERMKSKTPRSQRTPRDNHSMR